LRNCFHYTDYCIGEFMADEVKTPEAGDNSFLDSFKNANLTTPENQAVFWSNDIRPDPADASKIYKRNKQLAEDLTKDGNHFVLKQKIPEIDKIWGKDYQFENQPVSKAAKTDAEAIASQRFAEQASGTVTVYANYTGATSFFRQNELPALMANDKVTDVKFLDTKDKEQTMSKADWYNWQRDQWVDGRIEKLNDTNKAWTAQTAKWNASHADNESAPEPNKFAVGDFANEMAAAYRNIALKDKPSYIDVGKEQAHADKLQTALQAIDNPALREKIIAKTNEVLKDEQDVKELFNAGLQKATTALEQAPIETTYTPKKGEGLLAISKKIFPNSNMVAGMIAFMAVNDLKDPKDIHPDKPLQIPTTEQVTQSEAATKIAANDGHVHYSEVIPHIKKNNNMAK